MKRYRAGILAAGGWAVLFGLLPDSVHAQFLNRQFYPRWQQEKYENLATIGYRGYDIDSEQRTFDSFGMYMLDGVEVFRLEEYRSIDPFDGSLLFKDFALTNLFQNLVISSDSYRTWSSRLTIGRAVESTFTPLTLNVARLNGVRWDAATRRNRFAVVASRVSDPILFGGLRSREFANYLYGGRWEGALGDVLTFGASYVNLHYIDSLAGSRRSSQKGNLPNDLQPPETLFVMVYDDSPDDGSGGRVYDMVMQVDGVSRADLTPEIRRVEDIELERELTVEEVSHLRRRRSWLSTLLPWTSMRNLIDDAPVVSPNGQEYLEASGTDVLVYRFEVPRGASAVEFEALVSHDYSIDVAAELPRRGVVGITWDDWHNVLRAPGNPGAGDANPQMKRFSYSAATGIATYGADIDLALYGFALQGEYARNFDFSQYPAFEGRRSEGRRDAWYLTLERPWGKWRLGMELFDMPATFSTDFTYWRQDINQFDVYRMVEDNDDGDQWPDSWEHWEPLDSRYTLQSVGRPTPEADRNLVPSPDVAIGFGVFPGLDEDGDGTPDTNVNDNELPDYLEPFLMYHVEPEDFVFGDDFNNNGIVDVRENDNLPDYPYELDSGGPHTFVAYRPSPALDMTAGWYGIAQTAGGGENRAAYLRLRHHRKLSSTSRLEFNYLGRRVRDDIPSSTYEFKVDPRVLGNFSIHARPDPLEMRNSLVNTLFARARSHPVSSLRLETILRYEQNNQLEEVEQAQAIQEERTLRAWRAVAKADYLRKWRSFSLMPMVKFTTARKTGSDAEEALVQDYTLFPILRLDYQASPRTVVRTGVQGFPVLFKHRFRSDTDEVDDFDAEHFIFTVQTRDNYIGYDASFLMGYKASRFDFPGDSSTGPRTTSEVFLHMRVE